MLSYQHEMAAKCFLACLQISPYCALAHGFVALCHAPNYNFKGEPYYESTSHETDANTPDLLCIFPSQYVADRHSRQAVAIIEELRRQRKVAKKKKKKGTSKQNGHLENGDETTTTEPQIISDFETQWLAAIRILTCQPGVDADLSNETVGRPFADAMRKLYQKFPTDPDVAYCFAEALMVMNAWQLYEYPSGKPVSPDVVEVRGVLERSLQLHPAHAGLCHMYVHLSEMSAHPELALPACEPLRRNFPHAGHLIHMPTHIDVLVGDYEACVKYSRDAILADRHLMEIHPSTAGRESFYFGYIVHNYHMAVYGGILGAMEGKCMELANELNTLVNEEMFTELPDLTAYLESYAALEVHVMIRFGRWQQLLELELPKDEHLMLYRTCSILYGRALAYANMGLTQEARIEAKRLDILRNVPDAEYRILHNNSVKDLLAVDAIMLQGEIAYNDCDYEGAFTLLRQAVQMQDNLNYDEPWGKMQPIRHSLGGLLLEQGHVAEAMKIFREDLKYHPRNPWALVGLIRCLKQDSGCCHSRGNQQEEAAVLEQQLREQQSGKWADYPVAVPCECCQHPD